MPVLSPVGFCTKVRKHYQLVSHRVVSFSSPAESNGTETYGTLRYAAEAKRIETSVHMNEDPIQRQLRQQQEEITKLREQLAELERQKYLGSDPYKVKSQRPVRPPAAQFTRPSCLFRVQGGREGDPPLGTGGTAQK